MGNQLTARAPSQILSVENYLGDLTNFEFEGNLGSTRFFKVAKARHKEEGTVVIKVFAINDPSLLLKVSAVFVVWTDGFFCQLARYWNHRLLRQFFCLFSRQR